MIALSTSKSIEIRVSEGAVISFSKLAHSLAMKPDFSDDEKLSLIRFEKTTISNRNKSMLMYKSHFLLYDGGNTNQKTIAVNKPLKYKGIKLYQQDWDFAIYDFAFSFRGKNYVLENYKGQDLILRDNRRFVFFPIDANGKDIIYNWLILSSNNQTIEEGQFTIKELNPEHYLQKEYGFNITKANIGFISIFLATYKPYNILVGIAAILFILALAFDLWGFHIVMQRSNKDD
jgi:hypothetical protein